MKKMAFNNDEISAYVDGELDPARSHELESALRFDQELKEKVGAYQRMNAGLRKIFESDNDKSETSTVEVNKVYQFGIAASLFVIGIFIGMILHAQLTSKKDLEAAHIKEELLSPASFAHRVYTTDQSHPVEINAQSKDHLNDWLSNRLHTEILASDLINIGYKFIGGRLLPSNRMAGQFMYEKMGGTRIIIYLRRGVWSNEYSAFSFSSIDSTNIFYWINRPMGYAVVSEVARSDLLRIAEIVQYQFH